MTSTIHVYTGWYKGLAALIQARLPNVKVIQVDLTGECKQKEYIVFISVQYTLYKPLKCVFINIHHCIWNYFNEKCSFLCNTLLFDLLNLQ